MLRSQIYSPFPYKAERSSTKFPQQVISPVLDVRLNAMVQYSDVAGRDFATDNRWGVAGAVTYHPTENLKLTANYSHTYLWGLPDFGAPTNQPPVDTMSNPTLLPEKLSLRRVLWRSA